MSIPRNLGNFADNVNVNGKVEVTGINATGTPLSTTALFGDGTWQSVSVTPAGVSDQNNTSTGYFDLPTGTTAQRPASPTNGMIRFNTSLGYIEYYDSASALWYAIYTAPVNTVEVLIVAGGGGGGVHSGGGGGAGGLLYYGSETPKTPNGTAFTLAGNTSYSIVVGAGGAGSLNPYTIYSGAGNTGTNSSFTASYVALGGGGGGSGGNNTNGLSGGSGGGGGRTSAIAGSGTTGQGFAGGFPNVSGAEYPAGGGGGAGSVGVGGTASQGGAGGIGLEYAINGTATYYAGGGGGNLQDQANTVPPQGAGGLGGGGAGSNTGNSSSSAAIGNAGTVNKGGGGGGSNYNSSTGGGGGNGGSGVVILRYAGAQRATGGVITSVGGYTIHTFNSSGTFALS
jgi:hypothetical protein